MWYCIMLKVVVPPAFINMQFIELPVSQVPLWNMSIWDWNGDGIVSACHFVVDNALGACHKYALPPPPPRALETCARGQSRDGWTTQPTEWPASIPKLPLERCPDPHVKWGLPPRGKGNGCHGVGWVSVGVGVAKCQISVVVVVSFVLSRAKKRREPRSGEQLTKQTVRSERERCVRNGNAHLLRPHHRSTATPHPTEPPQPPAAVARAPRKKHC